MSEFKFACPVCGQHITAVSEDAGSPMECPTCFRKIVVPQAPSSDERKLILSAAEAGKPRPAQAASPVDLYQSTPERTANPLKLLLVLAVLVVVGVLLFVFWGKIFPSTHDRLKAAANTRAVGFQAVLSNVPWSLDVYNLMVPDTNAVGRVLDNDFICQKAILQGGVLTLRQNHQDLPEIKVVVYLPSKQTEEWQGQSVTVKTNSAVWPLVEIRRIEERRTVGKVFTNGYALQLEFGEPAGGKMPGKIYLCLPDEAQSRVGGTFAAEMRPAPPQRPR
jgi:hypothetical protein